MNVDEVARGLAAAFLAGDWLQEGMVARGREALGGRFGWLPGLARRAREAFLDPPLHDPEALEDLLAADARLQAALRRRARQGHPPLVVRRLFLHHTAMRSERRFAVPSFDTEADLARWLGLALTDLDWFADRKAWLVHAPQGPLQHYHRTWVRKRGGGLRLLEAPKATLKALQRRVLHGLLAHVPPHDAAHGFRPGRSVVTHAAPHAGKALVLRLDLRDFFPSVPAGRVAALFRSLGYPRSVAGLLTGLVTTRTPLATLEGVDLDREAEDALRRPHLPQGAPTSPWLANLCALRLDVRLSAAAAKVGADYTRYADDLAFSGDEAFRRVAARFRTLVHAIVLGEGFDLRPEKTRWMTPSVRQRLTGLVVNARPRPSRAEFDRLKATLFNCARRGPATENREGHPDLRAHLRGRVAWFEHTDPARGARLRALFERIAWAPAR